jgi:hypothetical protein
VRRRREAASARGGAGLDADTDRTAAGDESTLGVRALQTRGTIFWQCNIALTAIAQQLAQTRQVSATEVRADLLAGLNPGVRLVPSHVMAMGLVQERGVTYVKI